MLSTAFPLVTVLGAVFVALELAGLAMSAFEECRIDGCHILMKRSLFYHTMIIHTFVKLYKPRGGELAVHAQPTMSNLQVQSL